MNEAERYLQERLRTPHDVADAADPQTVAPLPTGPQRRVSLATAWKYFWTRWTFQGRASRSEYWWALLELFLAQFALGFIGGAIGGAIGMDDADLDVLGNVISLLWGLATLVPETCVIVRRLHDTNHSGGWYWIWLVPLIGPLWLLCLMVRRSDPQPNRYGPVPNTRP